MTVTPTCEVYKLFLSLRFQLLHWSRGMIPASGAGGPGFDSRMRPFATSSNRCFRALNKTENGSFANIIKVHKCQMSVCPPRQLISGSLAAPVFS